MKYLSVVAYALFLCACYGWGYALVRRTGIRDKDDFAFLSVVGIACLIFIGGMLNLARLAYPATLILLLLVGLGFFLIKPIANIKAWLATSRKVSLIDPVRFKSISGYALPVGILVIAVGFYAFTLLPTAAMNFGDDFNTYIPRPLRMLQTGTLAGGPYEVLGTDTLGAQAFLQGFMLLGFPIEYLQGFDAVFGFALTGMLLIAIGKKFNLHGFYVALPLIGLIVINPQTVNISPVYLGSAFILGIAFACCQLLEQMENPEGGTIPLMTAGIIGLLLAGLLELKNTFLIYALAYFGLLFIGLILLSKNRRAILKTGGLAMSTALLAMLPWLALYAGNLVSAVHIALRPSAARAANSFNSFQGHISSLFSAEDTPYGGSALSYGIIVLMLALIGLYGLFKIRGGRVAPNRRGYMLVATASCMAGALSFFFFGLIISPVVVVRYSCPVLIATLPFAWLAVSIADPDSLHAARLPRFPGIKTAMALAMPLLVVVLFWNNFVERVQRAYYLHITLPFHVDFSKYIEINRYLLSSDLKQQIRGIQYTTQPGQKILAWIPEPMHLDFSRNEIYSIMYTSLLNPWLDMPLNGDTKAMAGFLKGQGIRYILWKEDDGSLERGINKGLSSPYAVYRRIAERQAYLRKMLASIMNGGSYLYNQDGMVLFDLQQIGD